MKKKYLLLSLLAFGGLFFSCSREHQCKCFYTNSPTPIEDNNMIFLVDGSISCDDFVMMGFEEHVSTAGVNTLHRVDTLRIRCRDFND